MHLNEYQKLAKRTDQHAGDEKSTPDFRSIIVPLLGLAGEVGELLAEYKKRLRDGESYSIFDERAKEELGDILWYLANVASKCGFALEEIAKHNLTKTGNRWHPPLANTPKRALFDELFPPNEQLPRTMDVSIHEDTFGRVLLYIDGEHKGDPIRDNRYLDDGYRFHDIFHLAYAATLGWSPILRALLKRKRKSVPTIDEVEDGGRACVIEEGIAAMVFSYAERRSFLDGATGVSYDLLRTIRDMSSHLEVGVCTERDWERAIVTGFSIWRNIRNQGGGHIRVNLSEGTIELLSHVGPADGSIRM